MTRPGDRSRRSSAATAGGSACQHPGPVIDTSICLQAANSRPPSGSRLLTRQVARDVLDFDRAIGCRRCERSPHSTARALLPLRRLSPDSRWTGRCASSGADASAPTWQDRRCLASGSPLRARRSIIALPLPSNLRGQGLATAVKTVLEEAGIDTFLTFARESRNRLRALREGRCHIVVMSALAAAISRDADLRVTELPVQTFAEERRVFLAQPKSRARTKGAAARGS